MQNSQKHAHRMLQKETLKYLLTKESFFRHLCNWTKHDQKVILHEVPFIRKRINDYLIINDLVSMKRRPVERGMGMVRIKTIDKTLK